VKTARRSVLCEAALPDRSSMLIAAPLLHAGSFAEPARDEA